MKVISSTLHYTHHYITFMTIGRVEQPPPLQAGHPLRRMRRSLQVLNHAKGAIMLRQARAATVPSTSR